MGLDSKLKEVPMSIILGKLSLIAKSIWCPLLCIPCTINAYLDLQGAGMSNEVVANWVSQ